MVEEKRLNWKKRIGSKHLEAYDDEDELLGHLIYENVGRHMHWCWYQEMGIRMSPGCLEEVREKQKELFSKRRATQSDS